MLKQKFIVNFGSKVFASFTGMFAGIFVARFGGPEVIGTLATATSLVTLFTFVAGIWGTSHIKLLSEGKDEGDCVTTYTYLQIGSIILYLFIVVGYLFVQKHFFHYKFESQTLETVVWIMMIATFFELLIGMNETTFTGKMQISKANIVLLIRSFIFSAGRIIIVILGYKAVALAGWSLMSTLIILPYAYRIYRTTSWGKWNKEYFKRFLSISMPAFLIVVANNLIGTVDKILLQHYNNTAEVGYYSSAFSIGGLIIMIGMTASNIFFPMFSGAITRNDWDYINDKIEKFLSFVFIFLLPITSFLAICSNPILIWLLGKRFYPSITPFSILLFASFFLIAGIPFGNIITGAGKFKLTAWLSIFKVLIYAAFLYILINPAIMGLGAIGAALNLLLVNLIITAIVFFLSKRIGEVKINKRILFITLINIGLYILYLYFHTYLMQHINPILVFLILSSYFIFFYGILWVFKLLKYDDFTALAPIFKIINTFKYFKDEIRSK